MVSPNLASSFNRDQFPRNVSTASLAASEAPVIKVAERTIARMACLRSAEISGQSVITSASSTCLGATG